MARDTKRAVLIGSGGKSPIEKGVHAVNVLRVAANVADAQTVTIGSNVYEFDRAENGVTAGRIAVTGHADDTPANATNALIAAINASGTEPVTAIDIGANEILLKVDGPGPVEITCAETLAGTNNELAYTKTYGGAVAGGLQLAKSSRVPDATEVALGNLHFVFAFTPVFVSVHVYTTSTGAAIAWDGVATIGASGLVTLDNSGSVDWATTTTVSVLAVG
jgi:hypothetical protein